MSWCIPGSTCHSLNWVDRKLDDDYLDFIWHLRRKKRIASLSTNYRTRWVK